MTLARRVLLLAAGGGDAGEIEQLQRSLSEAGASVTVRACAEPYEALLDDIARADVVVCLAGRP